MRKVREVLRLRHDGLMSARQVARSCGIARSTVGEYLQRAQAAGLAWPLPEGMDDEALERALFGVPKALTAGREMPDGAYLKRELSRPHVTLRLLWSEYCGGEEGEKRTDRYGYTQFCEHAHREMRRLGLVMRQEHHGGEKMFVDWAGDKIRIVNAETGEVTDASLFVAVLGCSSYTFADVMADETSPNWIQAHVNAYQYFGGVVQVTVPDNTKTAVRSPCRYEPDLNPLYHDLAVHYGTAIIPARVRHPKDKACVEAGVLLAERWILARLRNRVFFSVEEAKAAVRELLPPINAKMRRMPKASRRQLFEELDQPALRPLPTEPYEWTEWRVATVGPDYHVEADRHYYSVPFQIIGAKVDMRMSPRVVEILHKHRRVASHPRSYVAGRHTTNPDHMPSSHRRYAEWTPARIIQWATEVGPSTAAAAEAIMRARRHPEQGFRSCLGLISLSKKYGPPRVETACALVMAHSEQSYRRVKSILEKGLDRAPLLPEPQAPAQPHHRNVRGPAYFKEVH